MSATSVNDPITAEKSLSEIEQAPENDGVARIASAAAHRAAQFSALRWSILLVSLPLGILNFVLPFFGKQVGASAVEVGLLFSSFSLMAVLLRPLVGAGLDRFGRRRFFIAGLILYGVAMAAFAVSSVVFGLVIARILEGAASALLWLSANAIIADLARLDERGVSFGSVTQMANQGGIIGAFIGFTVLLEIGLETVWKPLFLFYAAGAVLAALFAWKRLPETHPATARRTGQQNRSTPSSLRPLLCSRTILILLLVTFGTAASWSMVSAILMIYLQEKLSANFITLAWAFLPSALVWAVLPSRLGKLADRFGRKPLMVLSLAAASLSSFLIPGLTSLTGLAILWVIQAVCYAAGDPAEQALIVDITREDQRGRAFGLYTLAGGLGATIGPLAGGLLYDAVGPSAPFLANGFVLAACMLVLWAALKEKVVAARPNK